MNTNNIILIVLQTIIFLIVLLIVIYKDRIWLKTLIHFFAKEISSSNLQSLCHFVVKGAIFLPYEMMIELVILTVKKTTPFGIVDQELMISKAKKTFPHDFNRLMRFLYKEFERKIGFDSNGQCCLPDKRELEWLFIDNRMLNEKEEVLLRQKLFQKIIEVIEKHIELRRAENLPLVDAFLELAAWINDCNRRLFLHNTNYIVNKNWDCFLVQERVQKIYSVVCRFQSF